MRIFIDESGCLGFSLGNGSSNHLTLALLFLPDQHIRRPKKIISKFYRKYGWKGEKKSSTASVNQKILLCNKAVSMLQDYPDIKVDVITVKKENVQAHIREDPNKLYNYMIGLVIPDYVKREKTIIVHPDERSIKVKSGNSLEDFLKIKLWFEVGLQTRIIINPLVSTNYYNLQFIDWIANCIWLKYEKGWDDYFRILTPRVNTRELFFTSQRIKEWRERFSKMDRATN